MSNEPEDGTRQERREKKLQKRKARVQQHGRSLARVYVDSILKRLKRAGKRK